MDDDAAALRKLLARSERRGEQLRRKIEMIDRVQVAYDAVNVKLSLALEREAGELRREQRARHEDLLHASALQHALLPALPALDRLPVAAVYRPADLVGGDLYDVHLTPAGRLRVLVADATGHGVAASLRTMILKTLYERRKSEALAPEQALAFLNDDTLALPTATGARASACCFDLEVEPTAGGGLHVRFATAAHPPLVRVAPGGVPSEVDLPSTFIGLLPGQRYPAVELTLAPGERLFAYTDGLVEQWSPTGARVRDDDLFAALAAPLPLGECVEGAVAALAAMRAGGPQEDDITLVGVEYRG